MRVIKIGNLYVMPNGDLSAFQRDALRVVGAAMPGERVRLVKLRPRGYFAATQAREYDAVHGGVDDVIDPRD